MLLTLLPVTALLLALFLGGLKWAWRAQRIDATQARVDICAVRLIEARKQLLSTLQKGNAVLGPTLVAIYLARGVQLLGGVAGKALGALGERALLSLHRAAALGQEAALAKAALQEAAGLLCAPTPFSKGPALCQIQPALRAALRRDPVLFADLRGAYRVTGPELGRVHCRGAGAATILRLKGDPALTLPNFHDEYEK